MVFRMYFDGSKTPCVLSPVGDFFGLGHGQIYAYESEPLAVGTEGGMNSFWKMPFYRSATITVTNEGRQDCTSFYYYIDYRKYKRLPRNQGIFHAVYRQAMPCEKGAPYLIIETTGHGHYIGTNLSIEQTEDGWWGEGDDRIFIDGDEKPTLTGTGSEDYFCGAWGFSHEFAYKSFGQPYRAKLQKNGLFKRYFPDVRGEKARVYRWPTGWMTGDLYNVYRYHLDDPIPFRKSIRVEIEHGATDNEQQNNYSSVAYWYQREPHTAAPVLPSCDDRLPDFMWPRELEDGKFEGEDFIEVATATGGAITEDGQWFWGNIWSNTAELAWVPSATGDILTLPVPIAQQGTYRLGGKLTNNSEAGTFAVILDDLQLAESIDLYRPGIIPSPEPYAFGEVHLATGEHSLKFKCLGQNPESKRNRLGIDFVRFQRPQEQ